MRNRNNFHEDDLRHFLIKKANARDDGHRVGSKPSRTPSKKTLQELLDSDHISDAVRQRVEAHLVSLGATPKPDPIRELMKRLNPKQLAALKAVL